MTYRNDLSEYFISLTDEELIRQLTENVLRDDARLLAEQEVSSRQLIIPSKDSGINSESGKVKDDYVRVAQLLDQGEIQILKAQLEMVGIPAIVEQDAFGGAIGGTILRVPTGKAKQARESLTKYKNSDFSLDEFELSDSSIQTNDQVSIEKEQDLTTYRVYSHPDMNVPVVVKVGFSWPAFIFGPLWFLTNKMWVNFGFVTSLIFGAWLYFSSHKVINQTELLLYSGTYVLYIIAWFLVGKLGNQLLCLDLEHRGFLLLATVDAKNTTYAREEAKRNIQARASESGDQNMSVAVSINKDDCHIPQVQQENCKSQKKFADLLGFLGIFGGLLGLLVIAMLFSKINQNVVAGALLILAAWFYIFGVYCGYLAIERKRSWLDANQFFWAMQIPVLVSPLISYSLAAGSYLNIWLQPSQLRVGFNYWFGSTFNIQFMSNVPTVFGINVVALAITLYIFMIRRRSER